MANFDGWGHPLHSLGGGGQVSYSPDRMIIHFGTPPEVAEKQYALDRLRSRGFLLEAHGHEGE